MNHPLELDLGDGSDEPLELLSEADRWRARDVRYVSGSIERVLAELPRFELRDFKADDAGPSNPLLRSVVRLPRTRLEREMPVGVVSKSYSLAQHLNVAEKCLEGMRAAGVETKGLRAEVGLSELGEWMNLRIYFPDSFKRQPADNNDIALRVECFNSVEGSSRVTVLLGWIRFICSNGMIIGDTKTELHDTHDKELDLNAIIVAIIKGVKLVDKDLARLWRWEKTSVSAEISRRWVDTSLSEAWGKKAASRVFHICASGNDTEIEDPFESGEASEKSVRHLEPVPGARSPAQNLFDVSQALSWVATRRRNPEERTDWQYQIPRLLEHLRRLKIAG